MAANLRKYKFAASSSTRPEAPPPGAQGNPDRPAAQTKPGATSMDLDGIKSDILSSLRSDISIAIRQELKNTLAEEFDARKI